MVKLSLAQAWAAASVVSAVFAAPQPQKMARDLVARTSDDYKTCDYFYLQAVVPGKKYQKQNWLTIAKDGDGHTTCSNTEASLFHYVDGQLQHCNNYTEFVFTSGYSVWSEGPKKEKEVTFVRDGHYLDIVSVDKHHNKAQVCVAEDTTVFVKGTCDTPFKCYDIEIMPVCAYYPDGKLYDGGYEKPCDDNKSAPQPIPAPQPKPCPTQAPAPCPTYAPPPKPETPCPTPAPKPCPEPNSPPKKPCPEPEPKPKPCPEPNNPPSKPCPEPSHPPSKPCPTKTPTKPPCPDPSSDPEPHHKREVQSEFDD